ncbi:MAG: ATP-dependent zinc metalloprotease FtsH [Alphaproteobacteria bacterium]
MNNMGKNLAVWVVIALALMMFFNMMQQGTSVSGTGALALSDLLHDARDGKVESVDVRGKYLISEYADGKNFSTLMPESGDVVSRLIDSNVRVSVVPEDSTMPTLFSVLLNWFPMLLLVGVWVFFMRQMQSGSGKAMGFGKSRARLLNEKSGRVTFEDVAGIEEAKQELEEIVDFLKDPQKYQRLGGRIPRGVLLVGSPGTGKTLLARAIAGEANVPFFSISGSDFVEMFVGVGASRVRDMFEQGKKNSPCIIFIDEIDAVGRHRGAGLGGGNDEREQTLNQLLVEMDGFEPNEAIIIIAATNRPDVLDPALLRPGRFDRQVVVPNPDIAGREKILKVHMRKVPLGSDVDARIIARGTPGFSGADLANIVNEAALIAARLGKKLVAMVDFEAAKDKVMMGSERRSMVMRDEEKRLTAYHEAGHAIVGMLTPNHDPLHKVTIIPRGRALGLAKYLPEYDKYSYSLSYCKSLLAMMFGGRVAEQLIFGEENVTSGASSDIQQATNLARSMVTSWGMSEKLGRVRYAPNETEVFLGHSIGQVKNTSEDTARRIDEEVQTLIDTAENAARTFLTENLDTLHAVAGALLEYETLTGDEVKALMRGEAINRDENTPTSSVDKPPAGGAGKRGSFTTTIGGGEPEPLPS